MAQLPAATRPIVEAALQTVREQAPIDAEEVRYDSKPPRSPSAMWKLVRFRVGSGYVLGIGTFTRHATMFFYRGRELDQGKGVLQGTGRDTRFVALKAPEDARSPAVRRLVRQAFRLGGAKPSGRPAVPRRSIR